MALVYFLFPKSPLHPMNKLQAAFNVDLFELSDDLVSELAENEKSCQPTRCHLFIRVKSDVKAVCDFVTFTCTYSYNSSAASANLKNVEKLKSTWDVYLIYDFDINNFAYKTSEFKFLAQEKIGKMPKVTTLLFSDAQYTDAIKKDLERYAGSFNSLIVGSEVNLLIFSMFSNLDLLKIEVAAFWKMIFEIKSAYPKSKISTSLSYEQMRGTNFWAMMDRDAFKRLDFVSFSSTPLSTRWAEYSGFFNQLYLYTEDKIDLLDNYYDDLSEFTAEKLPIVLTEFRFPLEEHDPYGLKRFLELSNFSSYFAYATLYLKKDLVPSSYMNKTAIDSVKTYRKIKENL